MAAPRAVLVQVGDGQWSDVTLPVDKLMSMRFMSLLKTLKHDEAFAVELRDVPLSKCAVTVCASTSTKAPSIVEAAAARALEGAETLGDLVGDWLAATLPYLYIRVALPASGA